MLLHRPGTEIAIPDSIEGQMPLPFVVIVTNNEATVHCRPSSRRADTAPGCSTSNRRRRLAASSASFFFTSPGFFGVSIRLEEPAGPGHYKGTKNEMVTDHT